MKEKVKSSLKCNQKLSVKMSSVADIRYKITRILSKREMKWSSVKKIQDGLDHKFDLRLTIEDLESHLKKMVRQNVIEEDDDEHFRMNTFSKKRKNKQQNQKERESPNSGNEQQRQKSIGTLFTHVGSVLKTAVSNALSAVVLRVVGF